MKILYRDKHLVVAVKDAGVPSQPDKSGNEDMTALLKKELGKEVLCVHRLDTVTSGVMVYALTSQCAGRLSQVLSDHKTEKIYLATVSGHPDNGKMHDLLWHDRHLNKTFVVERERAGVKDAELEYKTIAENSDASLVKVRLHTGRTHQIRTQFAHRGWPVWGDGKYGSHQKTALALCCVYLSFSHPYSGKHMEFLQLPNFPWNGFEADAAEIVPF